MLSTVLSHNQGLESVLSTPMKSVSVALLTTSDFALLQVNGVVWQLRKLLGATEAPKFVVSTSKDFQKKKRQMGMASDLEDSYSSNKSHRNYLKNSNNNSKVKALTHQHPHQHRLIIELLNEERGLHIEPQW
ncbi:hypothetical protein CXB51_010675 [Gossypium anomalum]|uniref:Uncharacterized protein n=1 Tax=Gossypium anomalum TaxID=47600 RepID=A0A8J5YNB8_9ROSI|nr:hypothetical protein CXB51_010675 [Gossypium anomalum]